MTPATCADSVNSPNITLNVDTNRNAGPGAGNVPLTISTITIAETTQAEYSSGSGKFFTIQVKPGYTLDPTSNVTAQSATIGFNGGGINTIATVVPSGAADETLTFSLTSGTNAGVQDIIRVNGIKLFIHSAAGAAGPAQTTLQLTTSPAGGSFTNQGLVAANISKGRADHLEFSIQPGDVLAAGPILPAVKLVDFGGNLLADETRTITLAIQNNPGGATLAGNSSNNTLAGIATWTVTDNLNIPIGGVGYTLSATHSGAALQSSDTVESAAFNVVGGTPDHLIFSQQPVDTTAGGDILLAVTVLDVLDNPVTATSTNITLDSAVNTGGWPLLVNSTLTKTTVNGVATWDATDHLRIQKAVSNYKLVASGAGTPVETGTFNVAAAAPNQLQFRQPPSDAIEDAAIAPPVTVEIQDEFGNLTNSTANVALILKTDCGANLLNGNADASAGLATYVALKLDAPCAGATLEAASGTLTRTSSNAFDVSADPNTTTIDPNSTAEPNSTVDPNAGTADPNATSPATACGACGQGTAMALLPMFLMQVGLRRWVKRARA